MIVFYGEIMPYTNGTYYYIHHDGSSQYGLLFSSSGAFSSYSGVTTSNCNASISALYASGQAFNFIGTSNSSSALGDRIVSGTVNAVAEQTSGTVRVSGTLALVNTGNETCDAAHAYSLRINPTTKMLQMCRP